MWIFKCNGPTFLAHPVYNKIKKIICRKQCDHFVWQTITAKIQLLTDAAIISCKQSVPYNYIVVGVDV